jgi:hypothetical protein
MNTKNLLATALDIGNTQGDAAAIEFLRLALGPGLETLRSQSIGAKTLKSLTMQIDAGNTAARQGLANPLQQSWTGESALRQYTAAIGQLSNLGGRLAPGGHAARLMLDELADFAHLPVRLLAAAARLYAEVAPAVINSTNSKDRPGVVDLLKIEELFLNFGLVPAISQVHHNLQNELAHMKRGLVWCGDPQPLIAAADLVRRFAVSLCTLSSTLAPASNPFAALVAAEFNAEFANLEGATTRHYLNVY